MNAIYMPKAGDPVCDECGAYLTKAPAPCLGCEAGSEDQIVLSYLCCADCRPEARMEGKIRRGLAALFLAAVFLSFVDECGQESRSSALHGGDPSFDNPMAHIVEEPGGIRYLTECEVPTEKYNEARSKHLAR